MTVALACHIPLCRIRFRPAEGVSRMYRRSERATEVVLLRGEVAVRLGTLAAAVLGNGDHLDCCRR